LNIVRDAKGTCQIAVPPEWTPFGDGSGAAVYKEAGTAIAVVTSQAGQAFKPLTDSMIKIMRIPKDKLFENTPKRIFYQDRISSNQDDPNAYSSSVPAKGGTCSCRVSFRPEVPEEIRAQPRADGGRIATLTGFTRAATRGPRL
jgi:hypothetical protein